MKRICIVVGAHPDRVMGGAQYQAACLAEGLTDAGYSVFYLARQVPADTGGYRYRIEGVGKETGIARHGLLFDAGRLTSALAAIRPDVLYQRVLHAYTGITTCYGRFSRTPTIYHVSSDLDVTLPHPAAPHRLAWLDRRIGCYGLKHADRIVTQTACQAKLLKHYYGRDADLVVRNFHPYPAEPCGKPAAPVTVLWIGNFKSVKRPELFVRLAEDLEDLDDVKFVMLGRKVERYAALEARIDALPNLSAPGEVPVAEVNRMLAEGHVLVNTSLAEGFPNTFIQAWMRRVPVVSLGVDPDHVLRQHGCGLAAGSYEELQASLRSLIEDRTRRETMGDAAARHAFANHAPGNVQMLIGLIAELCAGRPSW